jgi:hypothetical protein
MKNNISERNEMPNTPIFDISLLFQVFDFSHCFRQPINTLQESEKMQYFW